MLKNHLQWKNFDLNLFTLSFQKEIEKDFKELHFIKSLRQVRIAMILAVVFYGVFGILDAWIVPEAKHQLWFIRFAIFCPYVLVVYLFSYTKSFKKYMQLCIASVVALAGFGITAMVLVAPYPSNTLYYAGLILVLIFGYTFFKLDFIYATVTGFLIVVSYEVSAIWLSETPIPILINNNFFFLTGNLFGMFACYSIELSTRKEYMQAKLLKMEQGKVTEANLELEQKVEARTSQLLKANKILKQEMIERSRAEEHVRDSESKYRSILESMEEGYYEVDIKGKLQFFNDSFLEIVGYDRQELMGANYRLVTEDEQAKKVFRAFNNVYVSHKSSKEFEWQIIRKDKAKRYLEASVSLITNPEGLPMGFKGVVRDVTDRNLAEESLKKAYEELKLTQSQLVQSGKLASIGELASGVAHELNQPLMIIRGHSQLSQRSISKGHIDPDEIQKQFAIIERNTKRMMNIINHLRTFSRQSKSEYQRVDVNQVLDDSFLMIGEQLRLRNIEIKKLLDPNLPSVYGEINQLEQVFLNLITNARDAITDKEEKSSSEKMDIHSVEIITRPSTTDDGFVEILFIDSGSGILEEDMDSIFDPFYTTKEVGKGTGLGLSISYGIISEHGGKIDIADTGEDGTTFRIHLPIKHAETEKQPIDEPKAIKVA